MAAVPIDKAEKDEITVKAKQETVERVGKEVDIETFLIEIKEVLLLILAELRAK